MFTQYYSKKQLQPIIDKYHIDINDTMFTQVVTMFLHQTNYQVWALKCLFGESVTFENIRTIWDWITENSNNIQFLSLQNVVSYKTHDLVDKLLKEFEGVKMYNTVKTSILQFNTDQRNLMISTIIEPIRDAWEAYNSDTLRTWYTVFNKFNELSRSKRQNIINTASAIRCIESYGDTIGLYDHLCGLFNDRYTWNKESMLQFRLFQTPSSPVVYDKGNVVILQVNSFEDSSKLCGSGRTGWCLTRERSYFNQYVTSRNSKQYFLFDFDKREDDDLAHVGFTMSKSGQITNAHSTSNANLLGDGIRYGSKHVNINRVLETLDIPISTFVKMSPLTNFKWEIESILGYVKNRVCGAEVVYNGNNVIVVKVNAKSSMNDVLCRLVNFTLIDLHEAMNNISSANAETVFIAYNLNVPVTEKNSLSFMIYGQDKYGVESFSRGYTGYGEPINSLDAAINMLGIKRTDFEKLNKVDPICMVLKYIDEQNEEAAIQVLDEATDTINVSAPFKSKFIVSAAIDADMPKLYKKIINHKTFDASFKNSLDGSCLHTLLLSSGFVDVSKNQTDDTSTHETAIRKMVADSISSGVFDLNARDINWDTALHIAVSQPNLDWVAVNLIKDYQVNINLVNDILETPLTRAIRTKNIGIIKALGKRADLVVSEKDAKLAQKVGLNLSELINPDNDLTEEQIRTLENTNKNNEDLNKVEDVSLADELNAIFADAFGF